MHKSINGIQTNAEAILTQSVLDMLNKLECKEEIKFVLRAVSPKNVRMIAEAALAQEYYHICQAAKEMMEEGPHLPPFSNGEWQQVAPLPPAVNTGNGL